MSEEQKQDEPQFMIQRVYIKDLSFETPNSPAVFRDEWEPKLNLEINTSNNLLEDNVYEVVLDITATVSNNDSVAFLSEVKQAGIFTIEGAPGEQLEHLLGSFCPNILFHTHEKLSVIWLLKQVFHNLNQKYEEMWYILFW